MASEEFDVIRLFLSVCFFSFILHFYNFFEYKQVKKMEKKTS